ncbi:hypothetical protein SAV31267_009530 [Streptomyces avermitilis]|uniref:Plastocyanin-like domain-containing protein n=1 Tax=Streptomyces avermitilis TaxID=33903 RepID=A0A4D4MHJ1_STRAX|nr:hypothetical protein SAV31267_009530 [Streptomyces avermitilis]
MTITHTDGYPVHHTKTDALLIGMAERYDVLITAKDGVFPLTALAEGKNAKALAILRTNTSKNLPTPPHTPKNSTAAPSPPDASHHTNPSPSPTTTPTAKSASASTAA